MVVSIINEKLGQIDGGDRKEVKELKKYFLNMPKLDAQDTWSPIT